MSEKPKYYSIGHVARITNLPTHTIRYWETMFSQLKPHKNRAGRRMYTQADIRMVETIQDLLHNQRFTIKGAKEALDNNSIGGSVQVPAQVQEAEELPGDFVETVKSVKSKLKSLIRELKG